MNLRTIKIIHKNECINVPCEKDRFKTLLNRLCDYNIFLSNPCNGNGTCGKCKVKLKGVTMPMHDSERKLLSKNELEQGIRLACKIGMEELYNSELVDEIVVEILGNNEEHISVEVVEENGLKKNNGDREKNRRRIDDFFVAIDIGTTTIAMALVNAVTGEVYNTYASLNHQRAFGADVISRIQASNDGKGLELKQIIEEDLWSGIKELTKKAKDILSVVEDYTSFEKEISTNIISKIIIAGNPTMIHLLMGYSCETLGKYPFESQHLNQINCKLAECISNILEQKGKGNAEYSELMEVPVTIMPGISAFVGGDIVADLIACEGFQTEEICMLIDLGTNGEMVLGNKERLLTTSTAAGPAFEGGNIICGVASIPGSISAVKIHNQRAIVKTIQDIFPPIGICGTGVVSGVAELIRNRLIDNQGNLSAPYHLQGYPLWVYQNGERIALHQKDIREFQMAKAAIGVGIDILIKEYGCQLEDVKSIYIAGGFGTYLTKEDALTTGLLPKGFCGEIQHIGNGALRGTIAVGMECDAMELGCQRNYWEEIIEKTEYIHLSENVHFQELYMKQLSFETIA